MIVLIVDLTAESQAETVKIFEAIPPADAEVLDLRFKLASETDFETRLDETDIVVLGPQLGEKGLAIARKISLSHPWIQILMVCSDEAYRHGLFRNAPFVGVRKVFPVSGNPLDFLQELIAIHAEFKREGRAREGRVIAVTQAKGGVGASTIAGALAEVASFSGKRIMLWDLDIETRDLTRSLTSAEEESKLFSAVVSGSKEITRETLSECLVPISDNVSILPPPDTMAESVDLVCHTDGINLTQRILDVGRIGFDYIIVDTTGRIGPSTGTVLRLCDMCILVIDDTVFGLTATDLYLNFVLSLLEEPSRLRFLINGLSGPISTVNQIANELSAGHSLTDENWSLPPIYADTKGATWPGSGSSFFGLAGTKNKEAFQQIAVELKILEPKSFTEPPQRGGILSRILRFR
ncbi:MAG: ParA family protein [Deltaproteobacteria bacterium]|nr:ParA family protein [Deltaproteobacteria bacterium]MCX7952912.1 ParA family protein [Deltaproteobacteria bacterium]